MRRIERSVVIKAPLEKVYGFTVDWRNLQRYFDYIHEVKPITDKTVGSGTRLRLKVKQLGRIWDIEWEVTEHIENVVWAFIQTDKLGQKSIKRYRFTRVDDSTRLTFTAEYKPPPVIGYILAVLFLEPQWRKLYDQAFEKLKSLIEADMDSPATSQRL